MTLQKKWSPVVIESPYQASNEASVETHRAYLERCIRDCIEKSETPYASHKMLTDALDDRKPEERRKGIDAGLALSRLLVSQGARVVFYTDYGVGPGMATAQRFYESLGIPYVVRKIGRNR